jgi:hypothetical protein
MDAKVTIFDLACLSYKPMVLDNKYNNIEDCSTWSIDLHLSQDKQFLVVGSNSKKISFWDISQLIQI